MALKPPRIPARTVTFLGLFGARTDTVTRSPGLKPVPCTVNGASETSVSLGDVAVGDVVAADSASAASVTPMEVFIPGRYPVFSSQASRACETTRCRL